MKEDLAENNVNSYNMWGIFVWNAILKAANAREHPSKPKAWGFSREKINNTRLSKRWFVCHGFLLSPLSHDHIPVCELHRLQQHRRFEHVCFAVWASDLLGKIEPRDSGLVWELQSNTWGGVWHWLCSHQKESEENMGDKMCDFKKRKMRLELNYHQTCFQTTNSWTMVQFGTDLRPLLFAGAFTPDNMVQEGPAQTVQVWKPP